MAVNTTSAKNKNVIQRHARVREPLPTDVVKLARPPQPPPPPMKPNLLTMMPTIFMALSTGAISFYLSRGSSGTSARSVLTIIPMITMGLMMMGIQLSSYRSNVKKHTAQVAESGAEYERGLETARERLEELVQKQQSILFRDNPPVANLLKRVQRRDKCLWERQPNDNDFLNLRLGTGRLPLSVTVKVPEQEGEDPRLAKARHLAAEFETVDHLPITTNINWLGTVGIRGQRHSDALYLAYTLVANIVTHHSPDEVYLYVISHRHDAAERWGWLRWLPHTNALRGGQGGAVRISFAPGPTDDEVLLEISQTLRQRGDDKRRSRRLEPHLVIIFDETPALQGHPVMGTLLGHDPNKENENLLQASAIFVQNPIPPQVNAMIEVRDNVLSYRETWVSDAQQVFYQGVAESSTPKQMDQLARSMAPLRTEASYNASGGNLPGSVRLVELLGATQPDHVNLEQFYSKAYDPEKVMVFPIGLNLDLKPQIAVLRDTFAGEAGAPHAMLAGMTGQGKSILLQAMVLSMAVVHPPSQLNFILADFKGEGELSKLCELPHVAGFVTDLANSAAIERFRVALNAEVDWRKAKLATMTPKVTHVRDFNKHSQGNLLPYLVIVIDEFAYGLQINPQLRETIDLVAKQGRTLGMHLILSTQRAADFDSKIRSNVGIRISLRVNSKEDSKIMLDRDEAFTKLQRPGQAFIQVGDNQVFDMFQAARADVPYQPEGTVNLKLVESFTIYQVLPDGRRHKDVVCEHKSSAKSRKSQETESIVLEADLLVEHMRQYCVAANYPPVRQIALPPLPGAEEISLPSLLANEVVYSHWHGEGWSEEICNVSTRLHLPIGKLDLPAQQAQCPLVLDFNRGDGNFMVVGPAGVGKSLFLRSLVLGLALTHTPAEVNIYILNRGEALTFFELLPHCHGNVIRPTEEERQSRLFSFLGAEIKRRRKLMREARVDNLAALRQANPELTLPALFLIVEDYAGFRADYEMVQGERLEQVGMLVREGAAVDLHLVVSSSDVRSIQKLRDNVRGRLALGMKSAGDYLEFLEKRAEALPEIVGRGYVVQEQFPLECQIAAPTPQLIRSAEETTQLKEMVTAMDERWSGYRPMPVVELPSYVELTWLWETSVQQKDEADFLTVLQMTWGRDNNLVMAIDLPEVPVYTPTSEKENLFGIATVPVGIAYETQRPFAIELTEWGTYSLLVGPAKSGKSDLLLTFCLAAARALPPEQLTIVILDLRHPHRLQPLAALPHAHYARNCQQAKEHLIALLHRLEQQGEAVLSSSNQMTTGFLVGITHKRVVLVIDDLLGLMQRGDGELFKLVDECVRVGQDIGLTLLLADTSQNITQARQWPSAPIMVKMKNGAETQQLYSPKFVHAAFQNMRGVALAADAADVAPLTPQIRLKQTVAQMNSLKLGQGRGVILQESEAQVVQFARFGLPNEDAKTRYGRLKQVVATIGKMYEREDLEAGAEETAVDCIDVKEES